MLEQAVKRRETRLSPPVMVQMLLLCFHYMDIQVVAERL